MKLSAKAIFQEAFHTLRPRTPVPEFDVAFRPYADVNHFIRIREGKVLVGLSDLLEGAPQPVLEAIAVILIAKLYRKPIPARYRTRYRLFLNSRAVSRKVHWIRRTRGRKHLGTPQGKHFNLETIFEKLNREHFYGLLGRPQLSWSQAASRTALGHYDSAHNAIIISKIFDRPETPPFLMEYILHHEMLHLKHPVVSRRGQRCVHSALFRAEEHRFPRFQQAKRLLDKL
ncbi:MAG: M48 family peptidase [Acidobacteria bacterium]|nr:M48 family peptidase [Acidobacteriota bacterium]